MPTAAAEETTISFEVFQIKFSFISGKRWIFQVFTGTQFPSGD